MICSVQSNTSNVTKSEIQSQNIQKKSLQIVQNIETIKLFKIYHQKYLLPICVCLNIKIKKSQVNIETEVEIKLPIRNTVHNSTKKYQNLSCNTKQNPFQH